MSEKRDYGFRLGQTVLITDADVRGKIDAVMDSFDGIQYRVCFWYEGNRRIEWVYANEIESLHREPLVQSAR